MQRARLRDDLPSPRIWLLKNNMATSSSDKKFFIFNAAISALALSFLAWLLLVHGGMQESQTNLRFMPMVNACFNALSATLLVCGFWAIKSKRPDLHRVFMVSAFASSSLFLIGYIAYHAVHGDTKFGGTGILKTAYLLLLASHVILSLPVLPMALSAFYFAAQKKFETHKKVTRILLPIWLYVSVTGVIVFFLLRPYYSNP
jgi:putative membrane protein